MRALILAFSILATVASVSSAQAGLSTISRETSESFETANPAAEPEANQQTEDQIGLTKTKRRDVQRRLARLGFRTKISGEFDDATRDAIARWQERRGYPKTGFLDTAQHKALLSEGVSATHVGKSNRRSHAHASRPVGGPIGVIGSAVGTVVNGVVGVLRR